MKKGTATVLAIVVALIATGAPIAVAIDRARHQGLDAVTTRALSYAHDVLHRSDVTADQVDAGIAAILKVGPPCSEANIRAMQEVDVASSYIQAIGYVSEAGDHLMCASLGGPAGEFDLGPVDAVTARGVSVRSRVHPPFADGSEFLVVERDRYAAIIHKDLPIDVTTEESGVSLGVFLTGNRHLLTARGSVQPAWIAALDYKTDVAFVDEGFVVAVAASKTHDFASIAAVPLSYVNGRVRNLAAVLVPIGVLAGAVLTLAVLYVAKLQLALPAVLKSALRRHEFFLVYQPVVDTQTGRWIGAEALVRWRRPNGEMVRPDLFIPVAEDSGLMERVTQRVIELMAAPARDLFRQFPDLVLSINLSAADIHSDRTVELLRGLARESAAAPSNFVVELTERGLLDPEVTRRIIHEIHEAGFRVAIDDFGTGYSSLAYLESFDIDCLKIDKSFVNSLGTDSPTSPVALHIIRMAKALHLQITAEGVETEAQWQFLREHGVHFAQGKLFGSPLRFDEFVRELTVRST